VLEVAFEEDSILQSSPATRGRHHIHREATIPEDIHSLRGKEHLTHLITAPMVLQPLNLPIAGAVVAGIANNNNSLLRGKSN